MKEATEFYAKIKVDREVQDKKFEAENAVRVCMCDGGTGGCHVHVVPLQEGERRYESELELMCKRQKKEVERQEGHHIQQFKARLKGVKTQQVRRCALIKMYGGLWRTPSDQRYEEI